MSPPTPVGIAHHAARLGLVLLLVASHVACVRTHVASIASRLSSASPDGAVLSIDGHPYPLDACWSGDREYFLGVDLADRAQRVFLRLLIDPMDGPRLRLVDGTGESRATAVLTPQVCSKLAADVRPTGWRVNTVRDMSGFVEAECETDSGRSLRVSATFTHCH